MEPDINSAIKKGYFQQVRFLIELGSSVNCRDEERRTPLMNCALIEEESWGVGVARTLMENGVSMNLRCRRGMNALHYACIYGRKDLVTVLLRSADFDIVQPDRQGNTPLHYAVAKGILPIVTTILEAMKKYNLGLNKVNNAGFTALMQAWRTGNELCAKMLMAHGADLTPRDYIEQKSAEDYKEEFRQTQNEKDSYRMNITQNRNYYLNIAKNRRPVSAMSRVSGTSASTCVSSLQRSRPTSSLLERRRPVSSKQKTRDDILEEDFLERAEKDQMNGHVIHCANRNDLRNKPDQLLNISPIECFMRDNGYHRHRPSTTTLYSNGQTMTNTWKAEVKKMYLSFQFQFTKSYCRPAKPKESEPNSSEDGRGSPVQSESENLEKIKKLRKTSSKNSQMEEKVEKKSRKSSARSLSRKSSNVSSMH